MDTFNSSCYIWYDMRGLRGIRTQQKIHETEMVDEPSEEDLNEVSEGARKQGRVISWDIGHVLVLVLILLSYVYQYYQNTIEVFIRIVVLTVSVGIITAIIWKIFAGFTIEAFNNVFDFLHGKNDLMCRVRSAQSEPGSLLDHLYMAVEWSVFPTLVVFFVLSFIAQGIAEEGKAVVENDLIFLFMFIIPPIVTFVSVPIRLINDSSLMRYDIQKRLIEPFGATFKRMFRSIGGVGAMASFAKVALSKGGIENTAIDTFTILLYIFPTMFIASVLYGVWHTGYLRQVEKKIDTFHYNQYRYFRDGHGIIQLQLVKDQSANAEDGSVGSSNEETDAYRELEESENTNDEFPHDHDSQGAPGENHPERAFGDNDSQEALGENDPEGTYYGNDRAGDFDGHGPERAISAQSHQNGRNEPPEKTSYFSHDEIAPTAHGTGSDPRLTTLYQDPNKMDPGDDSDVNYGSARRDNDQPAYTRENSDYYDSDDDTKDDNDAQDYDNDAQDDDTDAHDDDNAQDYDTDTYDGNDAHDDDDDEPFARPIKRFPDLDVGDQTEEY